MRLCSLASVRKYLTYLERQADTGDRPAALFLEKLHEMYLACAEERKV